MFAIGRNILILSRRLNNFLSVELKNSDITATELMYLTVLFDKDGRTQEELAQTLEINKSATTRTIRNLEARGVVTRRGDSNDQRAKRVFLTEKALFYKKQLNQIQQKWVQLSHANFTEEESEQIDKMLQKMVNATNTLKER